MPWPLRKTPAVIICNLFEPKLTLWGCRRRECSLFRGNSPFFFRRSSILLSMSRKFPRPTKLKWVYSIQRTAIFLSQTSSIIMNCPLLATADATHSHWPNLILYYSVVLKHNSNNDHNCVTTLNPSTDWDLVKVKWSAAKLRSSMERVATECIGMWSGWTMWVVLGGFDLTNCALFSSSSVHSWV